MITWPDGFPILAGQVVSCERKKKAKGTWTRYEGRHGTVEYVEAGEVRVALEGGGEASFLPNELILLPPSYQTDVTMAPEGPVLPSKASNPLSASPVARGAFQGRTERSTVQI